jgi:uncharacterized membrane protein YcaP (DUF421 family)
MGLTMRPDPLDPVRVWLGETSAVFLIEVALRVIFLYVVLLVALRLMGRRMSSQLTRNELLALVSLAAGVGPALQDPRQGLLPPLIIAVWVAAVQRGMAWLSVRKAGLDTAVNGQAELLLEDGRLHLHVLRSNAVSRECVFAELRSRGVLQLGMVDRMYMESNGTFSTFLHDNPRPGLSIVPTWDPQLASRQRRDESTLTCVRCGAGRSVSLPRARCSFCHADSWDSAIQ